MIMRAQYVGRKKRKTEGNTRRAAAGRGQGIEYVRHDDKDQKMR
jgi:hypothetical protein